MAKKRKVEQREQKKRQAQTIKRSRLLAIPEYAGVGLHREIGTRPLAVDRAQADDAFVSQLRYEDVLLSQGTITSAHPIPSLNQTLFTQTGRSGSCAFTDIGDISHSSHARWPGQLNESTVVPYVAFPALMPTSVWPAQDPQKLLACSSGGIENVYIGSILHSEHMSHADVKISVGTEETTLWESAIAPTGDTAAIAGSDCVVHLSMEGHELAEISGIANSRSLSWLNQTTIAASSGKTALLWDTRTYGSSSRFTSPHTITGVRTVPSSSGTQVLLSTNFGLALHDTRMLPAQNSKSKPTTTRPLLNFNMSHEGPQLVFDINDRDLIALSQKNGMREDVRILSLRTGQEVRTLDMPKASRKRPTQLVWREDERGVEFLQACIGERVGRWSWDWSRGEGDNARKED